MSNLTPEVRVNKNGVPVIKHVSNGTRPMSSSSKKVIPAPGSVPQRTFAGALRELTMLGVDLRVNTEYTKNFGIKLLAKHDPETLGRIIDAVRDADQPGINFWKDTLGRMCLSDVTKKGDDYASEQALARRPDSQRALSNSRLPQLLCPTATVSHANGRIASIARQAEHKLGINPGDPRYTEVQAAIIFSAVTYPDFSPRKITDSGCFEGNRDDISFIAENMDEVVEVLPLLVERRTATRGFIESLRSIRSSSLIDGAL